MKTFNLLTFVGKSLHFGISQYFGLTVRDRRVRLICHVNFIYKKYLNVIIMYVIRSLQNYEATSIINGTIWTPLLVCVPGSWSYPSVNSFFLIWFYWSVGAVWWRIYSEKLFDDILFPNICLYIKRVRLRSSYTCIR